MIEEIKDFLRPSRRCLRGDHMVWRRVIESYVKPSLSFRGVADRVKVEILFCRICQKTWPPNTTDRQAIHSLTMATTEMTELDQTGSLLIRQTEIRCKPDEAEAALDALPLIELERHDAILADREIRNGGA